MTKRTTNKYNMVHRGQYKWDMPTKCFKPPPVTVVGFPGKQVKDYYKYPEIAAAGTSVGEPKYSHV